MGITDLPGGLSHDLQIWLLKMSLGDSSYPSAGHRFDRHDRGNHRPDLPGIVFASSNLIHV